MASLAERIANELDSLITEGSVLLKSIGEKTQPYFISEYEGWYTRALVAVRQLVPERLDDFQRQYSTKRKEVPDFASYPLEDYVRGIIVAKDIWGTPAFDVHMAAQSKFHTQYQIVAAAKRQLSDILANIRGVLQADLFNSELDAARELKRNGYLRAAGAVAGVVLEGHLKKLLLKHQLKLKRAKRKPTIADYNNALKDAGVFDIPTWRGIQWLADIRNLCDHKGDKEPTPDQVADLIDGTDKAIKTLS